MDSPNHQPERTTTNFINDILSHPLFTLFFSAFLVIIPLVTKAVSMVITIILLTLWLLAVLVFYKSRWISQHDRFKQWLLITVFGMTSLVFVIAFGNWVVGQSSTTMKEEALQKELDLLNFWNISEQGCNVILDTSQLLPFKDKYKVGIVCGIFDTTVDMQNNEQISISNSFEILGGVIPITVPYRPLMRDVLQQYQRQKAQVPIWLVVVLIPNDITKEKITTLSDLYRFDGKVVSRVYGLSYQFR